MLEASITLLATAARGVGAVDVVVTLSSRAGHAVPTGDVFRALAVHAVDAERPTERDGTPRDAFALLERRFEMSPLGLREVDDTRCPQTEDAAAAPPATAARLPTCTLTVEWQARFGQARRVPRGFPTATFCGVVRETHVVVVDPETLAQRARSLERQAPQQSGRCSVLFPAPSILRPRYALVTGRLDA